MPLGSIVNPRRQVNEGLEGFGETDLGLKKGRESNKTVKLYDIRPAKYIVYRI